MLDCARCSKYLVGQQVHSGSSVRCYGSFDQHISAQLFPGPLRGSPFCQPLEHHLASVSPSPLPSYRGKPRLINCSFLALFPVSTALAYHFISASWVFWLLVFAFRHFTFITRVSIQTTAQGLSSQSKLIHWLPTSRGS